MKILLIAPQPFFRVRGTPINIKNVVEALGSAGHETHLLCYPFGEQIDIAGVAVFRGKGFPGIRDVKVGPSLAKIPLDALLFLKAWGLCRKHRYDVIHAVEESVFFAAFLARCFKTRLVYDMDSCISHQLSYSGFLRFRPLLRLIEWMERAAIRRSDFVLTVCDALSKTAKNLYAKAYIVQIEDTPDEDAFVPDVEAAERLRKDLEIKAPVVLYAGNFETYQGIELLVHSASYITKKNVSACFVLVGGEPAQTAKMSHLAKDLGIASSCRFVGKRPMSEIPAYMTLADVLVSPRTQGANTALKIYGYMQTGKAIVATNLETHTQVLSETCAFLAAPDETSFAKALMNALANKEERTKRGLEAKKLVEKKYSRSMFRKRVQEAYVNSFNLNSQL